MMPAWCFGVICPMLTRCFALASARFLRTAGFFIVASSGARRSIRIARDRDVAPHRHFAVLAQHIGLVGAVGDEQADCSGKVSSRRSEFSHVLHLRIGRLEIFEGRGVHLWLLRAVSYPRSTSN